MVPPPKRHVATLQGWRAAAWPLCLMLAGCGGDDGGASAPPNNMVAVQPSPAPAAPRGLVGIVDGRLTRDGAAWVPHGYFQEAFEAGPGVTQQDFEANANSGYAPVEYAEMAKAGADSVRIMLSQPSADPQNVAGGSEPVYSLDLVTRFIAAVQAARKTGLTVIVGIQDEQLTGETDQIGLPGEATLRVWKQLVPAFGNDTGIVLELFNEPFTGTAQTPSDTDWQKWANAMNATIDYVRNQGSANVLIADGLVHARTLNGLPVLTDRLNRIAYAAHPYSLSADDETTSFLDQSFGNFAVAHPVIISEWGMGYYCSANDPAFLITFLNYLQDKGIGIEMGSWDWGSTSSFGNSRYNFPASPVFSRFYDNGVFQQCTSSTVTSGKRGPGLTVNQWYTTGKIPAAAL